MKKISHYILTCFNISTHNVNISKNKSLNKVDTNRDENYLTYRFEIFEKYTLPSIKNQTNNNYKWIVLFHSETPEKFKQKIEGIQNEFINFIPVYLSEEEGPNKDNIVLDILKKDTAEWIITTRIDNDDAFSTDYIDTIQNYVQNNKSKNYFLNFTYGLNYIHTSGYMNVVEARQNHFISLVSRNDNNVSHVFQYKHTETGKFYSVKELGDKSHPMWIEIRHATNFLNGVDENNRAQETIKRFSIIIDDSEYDSLYQSRDWSWRIAIRIFLQRFKIGRSLIRVLKK